MQNEILEGKKRIHLNELDKSITLAESATDYYEILDDSNYATEVGELRTALETMKTKVAALKEAVAS